MSSANVQGGQQVSKGLLVTLGIVVAIAAAVGLWTFVIGPLIGDEAIDETAVAADDDVSDDTDTTQSDDAEATDDADATDDGGETDEGGETEDLAETIEVVSARDPFQPLASAETGGGGGGGGTASGTGTGQSGGDGQDTGGDDGSQAEVGSTTVQLVDTYTGDDGVERAVVEVNATGYDVAEGETFAERFQLLDIADSCATMLFGDSRFTLCEGDSIRK